MTRIHLIVLCSLINLICISPVLAKSQPSSNVYTTTLSNGAQVYLAPNPYSAAIEVNIVYKVGGANEKNGGTGVSHLLEHMLFLGTKRYPHDYLTRWINNQGGSLNAYTTPDYTVYTETITKKNLSKLLHMEANRCQSLLFHKNSFDQELAIVKQERLMRYINNPLGALYLARLETAYTNSPYHHPVIGWLSDLNHLSLQDTIHWYKTWYQPNNAIIVIVGNFKIKHALQFIADSFGKLPMHTVPTLKPMQQTVQHSEKQITLIRNTKHIQVDISFITPSFKTKGVNSWLPYTLLLDSGLLSYHKTGALYSSLVLKNKLADDVQVNYNAFTNHQGMFNIKIIVKNKKFIKESIASVFNILNALKKDYIIKTPLHNIKNSFYAHLVFSQDTLEGKSHAIIRFVGIGLPYQGIKQLNKSLKNITATQIHKSFATYFKKSRATIAILLPERDRT